MAESRRYLEWEACHNVRDVGGYKTRDGRRTRYGALVRSDNLCRLTEVGRAALAAYGVRTVIDLRTPAELALAPHPYATGDALRYVNISLEDPAHEEAEVIRRGIDELVDFYLVDVDRYPDRFADVARELARAPEGGVLLHCHAGKDRTGLAVAVLLTLVGVPAATAARDYALTDRRLQRHYADELEALSHDPVRREYLRSFQHTRTATMRRVLARVQEHGGPSAYLRSGGLEPEDEERIRQRLVE